MLELALRGQRMMAFRAENQPLVAAAGCRPAGVAPDGASLRYLLAWLPVALLTLKIKYSLVSLLAVRVISRSVGRVGDEELAAAGKAVALQQRRMGGVPARSAPAGSCCSGSRRRGLRPWLAAAANTAALSAALCHLAVLSPDGQVLFPDHAARLALVDLAPSGIRGSVPSRKRRRSARRWQARRSAPLRPGHASAERRSTGPVGAPGSKLLAGYALAVVLVALVPFLSRDLPPYAVPSKRARVGSGGHGRAGSGSASPGAVCGLAPAKLIERYRALTRAPGTGARQPVLRPRRGDTTSCSSFSRRRRHGCCPIAGDLDDLPNLKPLRRSGPSSRPRHYSTYPYTDRAWFSILTLALSVQPDEARMEMPGMRLPGPDAVPRAGRLRHQGLLHTLPERRDHVPLPRRGSAVPAAADRGRRLFRQDEAALKLAADGATIARGPAGPARTGRGSSRNFCIAIGPQIGHAPWPALPGSRPRTFCPGAGQPSGCRMRWLGELAEQLRQAGTCSSGRLSSWSATTACAPGRRTPPSRAA